jgi:hypothetical protein
LLQYKFQVRFYLLKLKNTIFNDTLNTFDAIQDSFNDKFGGPTFANSDMSMILSYQEGVRSQLKILWQRRISLTPRNLFIQKDLSLLTDVDTDIKNRYDAYANESLLCFVAWITHNNIDPAQYQTLVASWPNIIQFALVLKI